MAANAGDGETEIYGYSRKHDAYGFWLETGFTGTPNFQTGLLNEIVKLARFMEWNFGSKQLTQGSGPAWDLNRDGILTHNEANNWYRVGNGEAITLDAGLIDLNQIDPDLFSNRKSATVNLLTSGPIYVGVVYGKLDLNYKGFNRVTIDPNRYDFRTDDHPWFGEGNFWRNVFTVIGRVNAGFGYGGKEFMINFKGSGFLVAPPTRKQ